MTQRYIKRKQQLLQIYEQNGSNFDNDVQLNLLTIMDETNPILSEINLLLNEHHKNHGHLGKALKIFNKVQGTQPSTFFKDIGEDKNEAEWKEDLGKAFLHETIYKVFDDADKVEENLHKKLEGMSQMEFIVRFLNKQNASVATEAYEKNIKTCTKFLQKE